MKRMNKLQLILLLTLLVTQQSCCLFRQKKPDDKKDEQVTCTVNGLNYTPVRSLSGSIGPYITIIPEEAGVRDKIHFACQLFQKENDSKCKSIYIDFVAHSDQKIKSGSRLVMDLENREIGGDYADYYPCGFDTNFDTSPEPELVGKSIILTSGVVEIDELTDTNIKGRALLKCDYPTFKFDIEVKFNMPFRH